MKLIQYIGDRDGQKIFMSLNDTAYKSGDDFITFSRDEVCVDKVYSDEEKQALINGMSCAGRYVVYEIDGVFVADECHRDSFPFHLPGYEIISKLNIGAIISISGFQNPSFLSEKDKELMYSPRSLANHIHEASRKEVK